MYHLFKYTKIFMLNFDNFLFYLISIINFKTFFICLFIFKVLKNLFLFYLFKVKILFLFCFEQLKSTFSSVQFSCSWGSRSINPWQRLS